MIRVYWEYDHDKYDWEDLPAVLMSGILEKITTTRNIGKLSAIICEGTWTAECSIGEVVLTSPLGHRTLHKVIDGNHKVKQL